MVARAAPLVALPNITCGAGSNAAAALLVALAETFSAQGVTVLRCDLPYRQSRSFGPPGPGDAARDRAGLTNALAAMRKMVSGRLFLGGHSYGGRQSSMLCAELSKAELSQPESTLVTALLLLSYPLHPPRKPEQQRTCARRHCSSRARGIPSDPSPRWNKR